MTKELASKADVLIVKNELIVEIEKVRAELRSEIESKFNSLSIKFEKLNQKFNFMIILIIIALTLMNPVVAEIIKRALNL